MRNEGRASRRRQVYTAQETSIHSTRKEKKVFEIKRKYICRGGSQPDEINDGKKDEK